MFTEKRKEERSVFERPPRGRLHIVVGNEARVAAEVKDASPMGVRLRVARAVSIGEDILIQYQTGAVDLSLNGTVVWNSEMAAEPGNDADGHTIGVRLASPSLLQAFW